MALAAYAIPDRLFGVLRPEITVIQTYTGKTFQVRPAFVVDANTNLIKSARDWGSRPAMRPDGGWEMNPLVDEVTLTNDPQQSLQVVSSEHRREGGFVIKVITDRGWLVDLREDEFMEGAILGTLTAGVITGPFVWSRGSNQMRLVRVGGTLYKMRAAFGNGVK